MPNVSRRNFLGGAAAGAAGTAITAGLVAGGVHADAATASSTGSAAGPLAYDMHGVHQAGILTPGPSAKQAQATYASFDVTATSRAQVAELFHTLTERIRLLTTGGALTPLAVSAPPADSDVLGPGMPADGLTVTVGVGATLFDGRFGLGALRPKNLTAMRVFPNDALEPRWTGGDLHLQICADHADTVHHTLRDLMKHTRGGMQLRWRMEGYSSPPRPSGTSRNLLGFKDGTANPTGARASRLIWTGSGSDLPWTTGGSYQVVRLIRMLVEFWDRVSINEQERMFGRRRDSGAPLDGNAEFDTPHYAADPHGRVVPLDSHIRLANPRTPEVADQMLVRRSYNYDLGVDANGNMQSGHIFTCFQADVKAQFEAIQTRLADEPLVDYVQPFGGGYFFALPGVRDPSDWLGRALLG